MRAGRLTAEEGAAFLRGTPLRTPFLRSRFKPFSDTEAAIYNLGVPLQTMDAAAPELQPDSPLAAYDNPSGAPIRNELLYGNFNNVALSIGAASVRVLDKPQAQTRRTYLFIVNTHASQNLFLAFGQDASAIIGVPLLFNFGFMEFNNVVPQDAVYLLGAGAATTGVLLYSNDSITASTS